MRRVRLLPLVYVIVALCLAACSATQLALTKKDLDVQTKMSSSIFLELDCQDKRVYLAVRDTANSQLALADALASQLEDKGFTLVSNRKDADYVLQVQILSCNKTAEAAVDQSLGLGYAGSIGTGALVGGLIGTATHSPYGMATGAVVGGLTGGLGELVTGSLVKDVHYALLCDLKLTERAGDESKEHTTRLAATANKVNLNYAEAAPVLCEAMAGAIAGIL
ncbi:MAG: complement resistance protein TraT [Desulfovibrio sp.]|nr:complement resistance protein TraT [Desulfovibrio sp.]